ncbi:FkbM family methyltransferase [Halovenus sp. WSH3]|uniref:FkbM family methyltransferase n=1 Tax=Halovenus carboxidivorans TaxID=2692199 RepID=A0A6B0T720_9EURY|nr:class I SAM-dependent methyltransferase [Halovenus carboxidivorans]MXR50991.1 FkbM family methyltransferase [Halovenus carboxidivorans]
MVRDERYRQNHDGILQRLNETAIPKYLRKVATALGVEPHLDVLFHSPLRSRAWFDCYGGAAVDQFGNPLPWMPYSVIDFLSERVGKELRVFEYGSGNSTRWWSSHVGEVVCVEDDEYWYDEVSATLPANTEIRYETGDAYVDQICEHDPFDVISIDGSKRVECAKRAVDNLAEDGVIVFDDTFNKDYREGIEYLKERGFREIFFQGMGPVTSNLQRTSIFYRDKNCFGI